MKETGQIAYEAFGDATGWTDAGRPMPRWDQLPERARNGWRAAAHAAIQKGWVEAQANGRTLRERF